MRNILLFGILLFNVLQLSGQKKWTLDDCIRRGIEENLELKEAMINTKISTEDLRQSRLEFLPSLNGNLNADNSYGRSIDPSNNEIVSTQLFQTGISASTSLVLFQGFVKLNQLQYNKLNVLKGTLAEETLKNDVIFKVMNAYFGLCFMQGQLLIAQNQAELSRMNLKKIQIMVDAGIKAGTDVAEMEARLAQDEFRRTQAQNNVYKSTLTLQHILNNSDDPTFVINTETISSGIDFLDMPDPDSVYQLARKHLPQFKEMDADVSLSNLNLAIARGKRSPALIAQAGYGTAYYDSYRDMNGNLISFHEQLSNNGYQYIGLNLNIPLFNGGQVNRNVKVAMCNIDKTKTLNDIKERDMHAEIENACLALKSAADEYQSALVQEKSSTLNLQLAEKKWEQGTGNLLELTDARNRQASAQAEMLRTQLQYQLKLKTLQIFTGSLTFN